MPRDLNDWYWSPRRHPTKIEHALAGALDFKAANQAIETHLRQEYMVNYRTDHRAGNNYRNADALLKSCSELENSGPEILQVKHTSINADQELLRK